MNQLQLFAFAKVCALDFNISKAAEALLASQPAISRHVQNLESEVGSALFERQGKRLLGLTPTGHRVLYHANRVVTQFEALQRIGKESRDPRGGLLSLASTHTQSNYLLPDVICALRAKYPALKLSLQQSMPKQIAHMLISGEVNLGIATEAIQNHNELLALPLYAWNRCLIMPKGHALSLTQTISLEDISNHPLITYISSMTGRQSMDKSFLHAGFTPNVVISANDSVTIKHYVREKHGIGIVAEMTLEAEDYQRFDVRPLDHLFAHNVSCVALRRTYVPSAIELDCIALLAQHWDPDKVSRLFELPPVKQDACINDMKNRLIAHKGEDLIQ